MSEHCIDLIARKNTKKLLNLQAKNINKFKELERNSKKTECRVDEIDWELKGLQKQFEIQKNQIMVLEGCFIGLGMGLLLSIVFLKK